jgi:hypothetical protein
METARTRRNNTPLAAGDGPSRLGGPRSLRILIAWSVFNVACTDLTGTAQDGGRGDAAASPTDGASDAVVAPQEDGAGPTRDAVADAEAPRDAAACANGSTRPDCALRATRLFRLTGGTLGEVCATLEGSGRLVCWRIASPSSSPAYRLTTFSNVRDVDDASGRACVVADNGDVSCASTYSGNGTIARSTMFVRNTTLGGAATQVVNSSNADGTDSVERVLVRLADGRAALWGTARLDRAGAVWTDVGPAQSPDMSGTLALAPTMIAGAGVEQLEQNASGTGVCALRAGSLDCVGYGPLLLRPSGQITTLTAVPGLGTTRAFSMSDTTLCAVDTAGIVRCWGQGLAIRARGARASSGTGCAQGTDSEFTNLAAVTLPGPADDVQVTGGRYRNNADYGAACARLRDGRVACWGGGVVGATGEVGCIATPAVVAGLANVAEIAVSGATACARLQDNAVKCWDARGVFDP